jgi:thioredoxin-related protein
MKRLGLILTVCWLAAQASAAEWLTDLPKALDKAKAEKKMVLMDFTGSDWCPPCKALHKTVLTSPEFEKFANDNLILVEVDFPNEKPQTEELKASNKALSKKYEVEGFPTVIVLDALGNQLSKKVGYSGQRPKAFIADLEKLKKKTS